MGEDGKRGMHEPRRRRGADPSIGFSGYDTLSSDEESGELPWRADVDGFGVSYDAITKAVGAGAATEGPLGSVFGHGGGYGALGGGGEAAAAQKAVRKRAGRETGGCCCTSVLPFAVLREVTSSSHWQA